MFAVSMKCAERILAVCLTVCLAASAHARLFPEPLVQAWVAPKSLGTVKACVIKALDNNERTYSKISPSVRHVAKIRIPDSVIEIRPVKEHVLADVNHYVRLEKIADVITRIAFYSSDKSKQTMAKALSACGLS
jgi:hypothetical protein